MYFIAIYKRMRLIRKHFLEETNCIDKLEIVDQDDVVFSNCTELGKPMQIISNSNELQVKHIPFLNCAINTIVVSRLD